MTPHIASPAHHSAATASDVMHRGVISCLPETPIADVAALMVEHGVHAIVVESVRRDATGIDRPLWGVVADLDLVGRFGTIDAQSATAWEMAATPAVVVAPDEPLENATRLMHDYDVHHLLVVDDGDRRPLGVVSTLDVVAVMARELRTTT
jgi:CBS domain-containing protein